MVQRAEEQGTPVYVLRKNSPPQVEQFVRGLSRRNGGRVSLETALQEAQEAVERVWQGEPYVELNPQSSYVRRLQHQLAGRYNLESQSVGREPERRVTVFQTPRQE